MSSNSFHKNLIDTDIHVINAFTFADATARNAATVVTADIGKVAKQSDNDTYYILIDTTPTWKQIDSGGFDTFLELTDTPNSYTGKALQVARVNAGETDLEFSAAGAGDVAGPTSSTDNALVRFDSTTGKIIQNSIAILTDLGILSGITQLNVDNLRIDGNALSSITGDVNITTPSGGVIVLNSGIKYKRTTVADTDFTVLISDYYIGLTSITVDRTVNLPSAATVGEGKVYVFKDESGSIGGPIEWIIDPDGTETIDGDTTLDISVSRESVTIISDGTNWQII